MSIYRIINIHIWGLLIQGALELEYFCRWPKFSFRCVWFEAQRGWVTCLESPAFCGLTRAPVLGPCSSASQFTGPMSAMVLESGRGTAKLGGCWGLCFLSSEWEDLYLSVQALITILACVSGKKRFLWDGDLCCRKNIPAPEQLSVLR